MSDPLTPTCFSPIEEAAYYYEALAELAEQEALEELELQELELQEQAEKTISTNVEALPIPDWLLDEGHDLEPLELETLEVAA